MIEYAEALRGLREDGVRFLVVGVFGINLHAGPNGPVMFTHDCDLLLSPDPGNLGTAVARLRGLGYGIEAGEVPLPDEDPVVLRGIVRARACVRASRGDIAFDLPLQIAGAPFDDLWRRRSTFQIADVEVTVASLQDLLRSKELANRPKDRLFLETYRSELDDLLRRDIKQGAAEDVELDDGTNDGADGDADRRTDDDG